MKYFCYLLLSASIFALTGCGAKTQSSTALETPSNRPQSQANVEESGQSSKGADVPAPSTDSPESPYVWGVDLRDMATYKTPLAPQAEAIVTAMSTKPEEFFPVGISFSKKGAGYAKATRVNMVYGVQITKLDPLVKDAKGAKTQVFNLVALVSPKDSEPIFRFLQLTLTDDTIVSKVVLTQDVPVSQTNFKIKIGLMQRKVFLYEPTLNLIMIYPLGIGAFDELVQGQTRELTPRFREASIKRKFIIPSRTYPSYYMGRPFLRVSTPGGEGYTPYGLHYSITDKLLRGFVSHGCMRMRDKDLYELFTIAMNQEGDTIPVEMRYWLKESLDTPYPLIESSYFRIKNFGTKDAPETRKGEDKLLILESKKGKPPYDNFKDQLYQLFSQLM